MSQDFTKDLSPYEDSNNNPIRGQYHFDIPQDIEPNAYSMNIDYESHDDTHPDAYQYDGWIVIGHRPYFFAEPIIVPYNTLAVSEEAITSYEKFSTTFNAIVKTYSDSALTRVVKNLPYHLRVLKGQFKDYYENESTARTNIVNDYNTSSQLINITMPQSSGSTGTGTTPLKISDIYESSQTIQNYNTLFARCKGTRDRGTDNYVPGTVVIPLILGTTPVYIRSISSRTTMMDIDNNNEEDTVTTVCGSGTVKLDIDIFYQWAMRQDTQNNHMKYGYEDWRTDVNKQVMVGSIKLQTNVNGTWEDVPKKLLSPANQYTTILDNGSIIHTPNTKGELEVYYTNPVDLGTTKTFKYRFVYTGKVGATFDNTSGELYCRTSPSYGTDKKVETKIFYRDGTSPNYTYLDSTHTIELFKGMDNDVVFKTYIKRGNEYVPVNGGLDGEIQYTFYGEDGTVSTSGIGASTIHLPKDKRGIVLQMQYIPNSDNVQGCSTTFNIHYSPQETVINFENQKKGLDLKEMTETALLMSLDGTTRAAFRVDEEDIPITKYKSNQNVPVTGGSLKLGISRRYKENNQIKNLYETNLYTQSIPANNSNTETNVNMFTKTSIKSLITNMINNKECPFTSYTLHAEYTGSNDFLPKKEYAKLGDIKYTVDSPTWETTIIPRNSDNFYKMGVGDTYVHRFIKDGTPEGQSDGYVNKIDIDNRSYFDIRINATGNYPKHWADFNGVISVDKGIPFLKTNVQFIDKDSPTQLANGTTVPANTPIDIPYTPVNTSSYLAILEDGTVIYEDPDAVGEYTDGKTDMDGETVWRIGIPQGWAGKTNVIFRVTLQYKSEIPMESNVIDIPFSIN